MGKPTGGFKGKPSGKPSGSFKGKPSGKPTGGFKGKGGGKPHGKGKAPTKGKASFGGSKGKKPIKSSTISHAKKEESRKLLAPASEFKEGPAAITKRKADRIETSHSEEAVDSNQQSKQYDQADWRERKKFRQAKKTNYEILTSAKAVWEKARQKVVPKPVRTKLIKELMDIIHDKIHEIIFKHDASRVVQTCVKYGTKEHRDLIMTALKGHTVELIKSHYSRFLIIKIMKHGDKEHKDQVFQELKGHYGKLIRQKDAIDIIDPLYQEYASSQQKRLMVLELFGPQFALFDDSGVNDLKDIVKQNPNEREPILKYMSEIISNLLSKKLVTHTIIHRLLLEYVVNCEESAQTDVFETLRELCPQLIHSREGAELCMRCVAASSAKERKTIVQSFKGLVTKACENSYGYMVISYILHAVDDTVLTWKAIGQEITKDIAVLIPHVHASRILLHLLNPTSEYMPEDAKKIFELVDKPDENGKGGNQNSKKDPEVRRNQILENLIPSIIDYFESNTQTALTTQPGCNFLYELSRQAIGAKEKLFSNLVDALAAGKIEEAVGFHESRLYKRLIKEDIHFAQGTDSKISFASFLYDKLEGKLIDICKRKGGFIVLSLLESPATKEKATQELISNPENFTQLKAMEKNGVPHILSALEAARQAKAKEEEQSQRQTRRKGAPQTPSAKTNNAPTAAAPAAAPTPTQTPTTRGRSKGKA